MKAPAWCCSSCAAAQGTPSHDGHDTRGTTRADLGCESIVQPLGNTVVLKVQEELLFANTLSLGSRHAGLCSPNDVAWALKFHPGNYMMQQPGESLSISCALTSQGASLGWAADGLLDTRVSAFAMTYEQLQHVATRS